MSCMGDCLDLGPPPDSILFMPPPPLPEFFKKDFLMAFNSSSSCLAAQLCEFSPSSVTTILNQAPERGDYVEMPRKDVEWTGIGDTWLLVLVVSSIGVLLLGALLAMFLLKCREMNMFGNNDCSLHRQMKHQEVRDCSSISNMNSSNKSNHQHHNQNDSVLFHGINNVNDNRLVWATLTPRGTQHFISENFPPDLIGYEGNGEEHYESIENVAPPTQYYPKDYDYEDPTPLIESYQRHAQEELDSPQYQIITGNTDMRCSSLNHQTLRRNMATLQRPRVSSPTRIEHPNLPPLNLYPHKGGNNTLKRNNASMGYRTIEGGLPKYGL